MKPSSFGCKGLSRLSQASEMECSLDQFPPSCTSIFWESENGFDALLIKVAIQVYVNLLNQ